MADIPEAIKKHLHDLGLSRDQACWEVRKGRGIWAVKHFACERIAAKLGIKFDEPKPLAVGPDFVSLCVTGRLGDLSEWSVGEASSSTSQNKYYCAMAEKRAKDRVILKLIGVHGQVYAEDEADDFTEQGSALNEANKENTFLKQHIDIVHKYFDDVVLIKEGIANNDFVAAGGAWFDLHKKATEEELQSLKRARNKGGIWSTHETDLLKPDGEVSKVRTSMVKQELSMKENTA
jgi:hypothetical protein